MALSASCIRIIYCPFLNPTVLFMFCAVAKSAANSNSSKSARSFYDLHRLHGCSHAYTHPKLQLLLARHVNALQNRANSIQIYFSSYKFTAKKLTKLIGYGKFYVVLPVLLQPNLKTCQLNSCLCELLKDSLSNTKISLFKQIS